MSLDPSDTFVKDNFSAEPLSFAGSKHFDTNTLRVGWRPPNFDIFQRLPDFGAVRIYGGCFSKSELRLSRAVVTTILNLHFDAWQRLSNDGHYAGEPDNHAIFKARRSKNRKVNAYLNDGNQYLLFHFHPGPVSPLRPDPLPKAVRPKVTQSRNSNWGTIQFPVALPVMAV